MHKKYGSPIWATARPYPPLFKKGGNLLTNLSLLHLREPIMVRRWRCGNLIHQVDAKVEFTLRRHPIRGRKHISILFTQNIELLQELGIWRNCFGQSHKGFN